MKFEYDIITSRKNPGIIKACSLADKKFRDKENLFCFEGQKLFSEALAENISVCEVYFTERAQKMCWENLIKAYELGAKLHCVTSEVYAKLTYEKASQEIFTVAVKKEIPVFSENADFSQGYIVLESVRDPSNVGAILRSCAALGNSNVLLSADCADVYSYKTLRAAMGAVFKNKIYVTDNMALSLETLKKKGNVYAAALTENAKSIANVIFQKQDSVVIGNEGRGVSEAVLTHCDNTVIIPMQCGSESLNASVAAAILIWEKARQTNKAYFNGDISE